MVYLLVGQHILNSHHGGRGTGGWEFIILSAAVIEPRVSLEKLYICRLLVRCLEEVAAPFPSYLFPRPLGRLLIQLPQFVDQGSPSGVRYWWNIIVVVLWKSHLSLLRSSKYLTSSLCRSSASDILWDTGMVKLSRSRSHVKSENI